MSRHVVTPQLDELMAAHILLEANEPRDPFYRAATELLSILELVRT
jgi:hypothetical protein